MVNIGLVVAEFYDDIADEMEERARAATADREATIVETIHVPGAYDTPLAADRLARQSQIDAVSVIGAIVTGETDHDRVIADAAANGLTEVSLDRDTPVTFGITGPGMTHEQAEQRVHYGTRAIEGAIALSGGPS